jgi:hypothetical protein
MISILVALSWAAAPCRSRPIGGAATPAATSGEISVLRSKEWSGSIGRSRLAVMHELAPEV